MSIIILMESLVSLFCLIASSIFKSSLLKALNKLVVELRRRQMCVELADVCIEAVEQAHTNLTVRVEQLTKHS